MPNEANDSDAEQVQRQIESTNQLIGMFLDTLIQVVAMEFALRDAKRLDLDRVQMHALELENSEAVQRIRKICGAQSELVKQLLAGYRGTVQ